jgi:CheY-like chemotaxis protein
MQAATHVLPDLVISDLNMPKLDGLGLLRAIRARPPTSKAVFIMFTDQVNKDPVQKAMQARVSARSHFLTCRDYGAADWLDRRSGETMQVLRDALLLEVTDREQAQALRAQAARCRRLAGSVSDRATAVLTEMAAE